MEGGGFESHLELRFFLCPLMVDSLHLPVFFLNNNNNNNYNNNGYKLLLKFKNGLIKKLIN